MPLEPWIIDIHTSDLIWAGLGLGPRSIALLSTQFHTGFS